MDHPEAARALSQEDFDQVDPRFRWQRALREGDRAGDASEAGQSARITAETRPPTQTEVLGELVSSRSRRRRDPPGLHLDDGQDSTAAHDEIRLSRARLEPSSEDPPALLVEVVRRNFFPEGAELAVVGFEERDEDARVPHQRSRQGGAT